MRVSLVSETYPPEINGVALTVRELAHGLAARGHSVQVVRPRRPDQVSEPGIVPLYLPSIALPRYPGLRVGLPAGAQLRRDWQATAPDVVYVATEGPLGWSALRAARRLAIPVCTGFHTRFDNYAAHYGVGWATPLVQAYLRRFHRRAATTLVPTRALAQELAELGIDNVSVMRRAVDTTLFDPARLETALDHLVQNAIEASPFAEPVWLSVERRGLEVEIGVLDRGRGMAPDFLRHGLFVPFESTKAGGFGIGAFEARALVAAMGGRLEVQSREGEGTRFAVLLPLADAPQERLSA